MRDRALLVVRGDEMDPHVLRDDATNFRERFADWGRYGVSAFIAADDDEVDVLCATRLMRFATLAVFGWRELESAGVEVVPTFRTPPVTLCHPDLDDLVERLRNCEHRQRNNPSRAG